MLVEARVRGSGAGMAPPPQARLHEGWWVHQPQLRLQVLHLAVSGATGGGWQLCTPGGCVNLDSGMRRAGRDPTVIRIDTRKSCKPVAAH